VPAAAKTSEEAILSAARRLLERGGPEAVSMQAVADAVGIRAPSLYKRFDDRAALLGVLEREAFQTMRKTLDRVARTSSAERDIAAMAHAYRRFAKTHASAYALMFQPSSFGDDEARAIRGDAVTPVLARLEDWLGEDDVLAAARVLTAFLHGFVSMELSGAFRLGPGLDRAFEKGVNALLRGLRT
jgi:AcrR family transcriptional regulator